MGKYESPLLFRLYCKILLKLCEMSSNGNVISAGKMITNFIFYCREMALYCINVLPQFVWYLEKKNLTRLADCFWRVRKKKSSAQKISNRTKLIFICQRKLLTEVAKQLIHYYEAAMKITFANVLQNHSIDLWKCIIEIVYCTFIKYTHNTVRSIDIHFVC